MLDLSAMQQMQRVLQERYRDKWPALSPEIARDKLLWMMAEAGEAAQLIKKQGDGRIRDDEAVRAAFVEELCDVLMYWNDVLLCYGVAPEEAERVYRQKHEKNLNRW